MVARISVSAVAAISDILVAAVRAGCACILPLNPGSVCGIKRDNGLGEVLDMTVLVIGGVKNSGNTVERKNSKGIADSHVLIARKGGCGAVNTGNQVWPPLSEARIPPGSGCDNDPA